MKGACFLGALALLVAPLRQELGPAERKWLETVVPRMATPEAQLGHARRLKRELGAKTGDERLFWRKLAVEAYQAVRVFHPEARTVAAEAAFRAGEILRSAEQDGPAAAEFRWCAQHARGTDFRARARLELGHLERRAERWREALELYVDVAADPEAAPARREDAWLWAGGAWSALGRAEDARTAWRRVAEQGSDDLLRVRAFDELGLSWLAAGDVEAAAGELARALELLSPRALEETESGERMRDALLRMRIVEELPRAIAARRASSAPPRTARSP